MTKPTKQQLQEEALEKKFGIPAVVLTLVTIVFYVAMAKSITSLEGRDLGGVFGILAMVATLATVINIIGAVKINFGFLRWVLIISAGICTIIAGWAWFGKEMLAP